MSGGWRGPVAVGLMLVLGAAGGYGAALAGADEPAGAGSPRPVVATSPSIPVDPPPVLAQDPAIEPLSTDLDTRRRRFRDLGFSFTYPRPRGWSVTRVDDDEKWRDPRIRESYTYLLRVRKVRGTNETIARVLSDRVRDLDSDQLHFEPLEQTDDFLAFTYVTDGHLRHGLLQWVDLSGSGFAEVEVAVTGRKVDEPGLRALLDTVVRGLRLA